MHPLEEGDGCERPADLKTGELEFFLKSQISLEVLPHHGVVFKMQLPLAFQLEFLLDGRKEVALVHQAVYCYAVGRGCQEALLEECEFEEFWFLLGVEEEGEVVAERDCI